MLGRLRTYPQPVFAQKPFLQRESLLLLVPHSVPALASMGSRSRPRVLLAKKTLKASLSPSAIIFK